MPGEKIEAGIQENLLRISVGLENKEDLLNDLVSALE
jgi:cystathionine beta-lyase/cystathionine gamma-synthase